MVGPHLKAQPGTLVSADTFNRLLDEVAALQRIAIGMFLQGGMGPMGLEIGVDVPSLRAWILSLIEEHIDDRSGVSFFAAITGATADGDGTNRWTYSFWEVVPSADAYGTGSWTNVETGHNGTARNGAEVPNTSAGVQGTGVDVDNLATVAPGMEHQPIPPGVIVRMYAVEVGGTWRYWFTVPNGIDGTCEAEA